MCSEHNGRTELTGQRRVSRFISGWRWADSKNTASLGSGLSVEKGLESWGKEDHSMYNQVIVTQLYMYYNLFIIVFIFS